MAYLKLGTVIYLHLGLGRVHGGAVKISAATFGILAVPRDTDYLKVLSTRCNPVGLISFSTRLQCSVETASMLGEGGVVDLKPIIAGGPGFFEREVVVASSFKVVLKIRSGTRTWTVPRSSKASVSVQE